MKKASRKKKKKLICIRLICWIIIPFMLVAVLVLDGLELYIFNTQRLIVMGACILVVLIPFLNEITIKNFSIKKENDTE